jgi:hypothetical protein
MPTSKRLSAAELRGQLEDTRAQLRQAHQKLLDVRRQLRRERQAHHELWKELRELGLAEQLELARKCAADFRARLAK